MVGRILNRRELRKQADQAEPPEAIVSDPAAAVAPTEVVAARKSGAPPKTKKPRKPKAAPRMRACWGVFDGGMKEVEVFDYNQRAAAEEKLASLLGKQKGLYFIQIVKQPMPEQARVSVAGLFPSEILKRLSHRDRDRLAGRGSVWTTNSEQSSKTSKRRERV